MSVFLEYVIVFVLVYIFYYIFFVRNNREYDIKRLPVELLYLKKIYKVSISKDNYNNYVNICAIVNTFIITTIYIILMYLVSAWIIRIILGVILLILMLIIFVDGNYLNSLVLSLEEELVVEEVSVSTESARTKAELMQNVIVNDESVVSNYVTNMNATTSNNWAWPTNSNYVITSGYGSRWGSKHQAIDISGTGYGSNIYAVNNGVVVTARGGCVTGDKSCNGRGGNYVIIKHNVNNYYTVYMHLKDIKVSLGQDVSGGQVIGTMGNTGNVVPVPVNSNSTVGTHLHFCLYIGEPYRGGYAINPMSVY